MTDDLGTPCLRLEREGPIAWCVIDRPGARNALTPAMYYGIKRAVRLVNTEPELSALVITGTGDVFAPGGDLGGRSEGEEEVPQAGGPDVLPFLAVRDSPAPVIAAVNGICQAGGLLIAMMADIAVASDRATFRVPELLRGIPTRPMPPRSRLTSASRWHVTCSCRRAPSTRPRPFASGSSPGSSPTMTCATQRPRRPTRCSALLPSARVHVKRMLNERYGPIDYQTMFWALDHSPEPREGMRAFMEKRRPDWVVEDS